MKKCLVGLLVLLACFGCKKVSKKAPPQSNEEKALAVVQQIIDHGYDWEEDNQALVKYVQLSETSYVKLSYWLTDEYKAFSYVIMSLEENGQLVMFVDYGMNVDTVSVIAYLADLESGIIADQYECYFKPQAGINNCAENWQKRIDENYAALLAQLEEDGFAIEDLILDVNYFSLYLSQK